MVYFMENPNLNWMMTGGYAYDSGNLQVPRSVASLSLSAAKGVEASAISSTRDCQKKNRWVWLEEVPGW